MWGGNTMCLDEFANRFNELIAEAGIKVSDVPGLLGVDRKSVRLWCQGIISFLSIKLRGEIISKIGDSERGNRV